MSFPISFPTTLTFSSFKITPRNVVARTESPYTLSDKVYEWGGQAWMIEGTLPLMTRETAEAYTTFLLKLRGRAGTFLLPIPDAVTPRGVATGTPLVKGAGQTGYTLVIDGLTPGVNGIFLAGDYIQLGTGSTTRLHKLLDDANSNGSGEATLNIWPMLRSSPADNAAVTVSNCKGLFRLDQDYGVDIDSNKHYLMSFAAMEALDGT